MIVHVPFSYQIDARYGTSRRIVQATLRGVEPVELREVDAPLAATWLASSVLQSPCDPASGIAIRLSEKGLVVPCGQEGRLPGLCTRPPTDWAEAIAAGRQEAWNPFSGSLDESSIEEGGPPHPARVVASGRDAAVSALRELAASIVLVDGVPHEPCPEPYLVVSADWEAGDRAFARVLVPASHATPQNPARCFRLGDWDAVLAHEARACARFGKAPALPARNPFAVVAAPSAFRAPFESRGVGAAAVSLYHALSVAIASPGGNALRAPKANSGAWEPGLELELPDPALVGAYVEIGAMLRVGLSDAATPRLESLASGILSALPEGDGPSVDLTTVRNAARTAFLALERFSGRPSWITDDVDDLFALAP